MKQSRLTSTLVVFGLIVLASSAVAGLPPEIEVEHKTNLATGWDVEVVGVDTGAHPGAELIFRMKNASGTFLHTAQVAATLTRADGEVRSYVQYVVDARLEPGESRYVTRTLPFSDIREGDRLMVTTEVLAPQGARGAVFEKNGPAQCTTYCDRCADKAAALCAHGVSTYSCSCKEGHYVCTFDCNIPSV